jgi:hypothetical protein
MAHSPELALGHGMVIDGSGGEPTGALPGKLVRGAQPRRN